MRLLFPLPPLPLDDAIVEFGKQNGVQIIRGPEDNVLARFALAAEAMDADIVVRVSSDAPFIDAGFIDHLLTALISQSGGLGASVFAPLMTDRELVTGIAQGLMARVVPATRRR